MTTESRWANAGLAILVALCIACFGACGGKGEGKADAGKQEPGAAKAGGKPKIVAEQSAFEFGKVKQGVDVEHVFKIRNAGDAELRIDKARGS